MREKKEHLYPNEKVIITGGFPALSWYKAADKTNPLVVFITGGGVLGRIAYGHPGSCPEDFLAHWFCKAGHSFLALTYPMEHPVFPTVHPDFTVQDWGKQCASVIAMTIAQNRLLKKIVLLPWSMAGRVVPSVTRELQKKGIEVILAVGLSANTPAQTIIIDLSKVKISPKGLGTAELTPGLKANLNLKAVPLKIFKRDYLGNYPMNLAATPLRYRRGRFVSDEAEDLRDTGAWNFSDFPLVSLIHGDALSDARHVLLDKEVWAPYIAQIFFQKVVEKRLDRSEWKKTVAFFRQLSDRLTGQVRGGHFFFVGKEGAKATVSEAKKLMKRVLNFLG